MRLKRGVLGFLAFVALPLWAQNTGWLNPSLDFGAFRNPTYAYYDDNLFARGEIGDTHVYYGYRFSIPAEAEILGIEVRLDAWRWPAGVPFYAYLRVQLSGDGGRSWTSAYTAGPLAGYEQTFILGGPTDLWGRTWQPGNFQPQLFVVRLEAVAPRGREVRLDWVAVRVHYRTGLALEIEPGTVDLGTLTLVDYDRGYRDLLEAQVVRVTSSTTWALSVAALTPTWRYSGDLPDPKKPCGHLLWRVEHVSGPVSWVETTFVPLATAERTVAQGTAGTAKLSLSFRLIVDYEATWPGTYALDFRYTLISP